MSVSATMNDRFYTFGCSDAGLQLAPNVGDVVAGSTLNVEAFTGGVLRSRGASAHRQLRTDVAVPIRRVVRPLKLMLKLKLKMFGKRVSTYEFSCSTDFIE